MITLPNQYRVYLQSHKCSGVTVRNYVADLNHFFNWLYQKTQISHEVAGLGTLKLFNAETLQEYQHDSVQAQTPPATINRRQASLRKFAEFALNQGWLAVNPTVKMSNIDTQDSPLTASNLLQKFSKYLQKEHISPISIKNYVADTKHFINWLDSQ